VSPFRTALAVAAAIAAGSALAQTYPAKPVTVVVPWPAGGPSDIAARPLAKGLAEGFKQPFVVDNRAGSSGNIGSTIVARAQPDGYTLLVTSSAPIVINPALYRQMPYDAQKDLQPITNVLRVPLVLAVHPSVPAKTVKELRAYIHDQKGRFAYASSGSGTPQHLTAELFRSVAGLEMTHIPYKGSGGHVTMLFDSTIAILPHLKSGKLRPIAVTGARRSPQLPDVPTFTEAGLPEVESYAWYGFFARSGTPQEVVARLNAEALRVMKEESFQAVLRETGSEYVGDSPENFARFVQAESAKWARVVRASGATVD
jgi:tripartite-type tricarboxylate transporter receptor subunit TctC